MVLRQADSGAVLQLHVKCAAPAVSQSGGRPAAKQWHRTLFGRFELETAIDGRRDDGLGEDVMRGQLKRCPKREDLVRIFPRSDFNRKQPRTSNRESAGFVEEHGARTSQRLQCPSSLD